MTSKDFEAMAGVIRDTAAETAGLTFQSVITPEQKVERDMALLYVRDNMIAVFKAANPRFDAGRFIEACKF